MSFYSDIHYLPKLFLNFINDSEALQWPVLFHIKFQAIQFSKNKTDLSRKNEVFEVTLKRKRDPSADVSDDDDDPAENGAEES